LLGKGKQYLDEKGKKGIYQSRKESKGFGVQRTEKEARKEEQKRPNLVFTCFEWSAVKRLPFD
jgi:hypothetical protein